jgi:hypothetical protein
MSIFGWLTLKEAERYTLAVEQKKIAGRAIGATGDGRCDSLSQDQRNNHARNQPEPVDVAWPL